MRDVALITVECARYDRRHVGDAFPDDAALGITPGHYTRPSLAAILSGQYRAAVQSRVRSPTLAEVLSKNGYTTIGVSYSPQTSAAFDFNRGFDEFCAVETPTGPLGRGSYWRERLGRNPVVRAIHHYVKPKMPAANLESQIKHDSAAISQALGYYDAAASPRFLWIHLMGSHRPYGWTEDTRLAEWLDRKAANATPNNGLLSTSLTDDERTCVVDAYEAALKRVGMHVEWLRQHIDDDAAVITVGDHGDELGEEGYYYHGGYRRRVVDAITHVPVHSTVDVPDRFGLAAVPHVLADAAGVDSPSVWVRPDSGCWVTVAPWADRATIRVDTPGESLVFKDASIGHVSRSVAESDIQRQLRALGYMEEG